MLSRRQVIATLSVITLIGIVLRAYRLDFQCYWIEEAFTLMMIHLPYNQMLLSSFTIDANTPVYYTISWMIGLVLGFPDIAIRFPSMLAGVLTVPAMYLLGKEYRDETTGLFAAGITSVLYPLIYYSQFGRSYATAWLFFVITLVMYVRVHKNPKSEFDGILFGIFSLLAIWTHLSTAIPISIMLIDLIVTYRRKMVLPVATMTVLGSPALLYIPSLINLMLNSNNDASYGIPMMKLLLATPVELLGPAFIWLSAIIATGWFLDKSELKFRLAIISIVTMGSVIAISDVMAIFPRYYSTPIFIGILFASVMFAELFAEFKLKPVHVVALLFVVIVLLGLVQYPSFIEHYFVQRYIC